MKRQIFLAVAIIFLSLPAVAKVDINTPIIIDHEKFKVWLSDFKKEAIHRGISQNTLDEALRDIEPIKKIIELDRKQPEFTKTFKEYIRSVVPESRIKKGRKLIKENRGILDEVSEKYGVQKRFIVALWGIETDFGDRTGGYYIPEALATLAFDGRRSSFFRKELLNSLKIIDEGHIEARKMRGSWAGAMGQTQFMPSSFLSYAQDYDGDGHKNIWTSREDAFASIANYLKSTKWDNKLTWGRKVKLPKNFDEDWIKENKSLGEWQRLGVRKENGENLPQKHLKAMLSMPGGKNSDAFLVYDNYKRILKWNRSDYFATAVGYLSDALR